MKKKRGANLNGYRPKIQIKSNQCLPFHHVLKPSGWSKRDVSSQKKKKTIKPNAVFSSLLHVSLFKHMVLIELAVILHILYPENKKKQLNSCGNK